MPDHDGRPPRAREHADATAPARKRTSRDPERVESYDEETEASAADEPCGCSPTWSVVSLSELTSRASSPSDVSSSSVVAAAATVSCATSASASALAALEDEAGEDERRRFSNRPPSVHQASDTKPPRVDSRVSERGGSDETSGAFFFTEETFASPLRESPTPNANANANANAKPEEEEEEEEQPPCVGSAASAARGLVACLRAAAALRLRALARALEAEGDAATRDAAFFAECFASARVAFARVSRRAAAALENAARTVRGTTRVFVADARDTFRALAEAFGSERRARRSEGVFGTVDDGLDEEEKRKRRDASADDTPAAHRFMSRDFLVAAAVALAPLTPATLWCAFSSACSKRT